MCKNLGNAWNHATGVEMGFGAANIQSQKERLMKMVHQAFQFQPVDQDDESEWSKPGALGHSSIQLEPS